MRGAVDGRLGTMTKRQTERASHLTERLGQFILNKDDGISGGYMSDLQESGLYGGDAQRTVEIMRGDLTIRVEMMVTRNDN